MAEMIQLFLIEIYKWNNMKFFVYIMFSFVIGLQAFSPKETARLNKFEILRSLYSAEPALQEVVQKEYDAREYTSCSSSAPVYKFNNIPYILKAGYFDHRRLLGYERIKQAIDSLHAQYVRLPEKKLCMMEDHSGYATDKEVVIAEDVERNYEARPLSTVIDPIPLHEFKELMQVLQKAQYWDFHAGNIYYSEKNHTFYIIDTELRSFYNCDDTSQFSLNRTQQRYYRQTYTPEQLIRYLQNQPHLQSYVEKLLLKNTMISLVSGAYFAEGLEHLYNCFFGKKQVHPEDAFFPLQEVALYRTIGTIAVVFYGYWLGSFCTSQHSTVIDNLKNILGSK
jgi:hypothetical protein